MACAAGSLGARPSDWDPDPRRGGPGPRSQGQGALAPPVSAPGPPQCSHLQQEAPWAQAAPPEACGPCTSGPRLGFAATLSARELGRQGSRTEVQGAQPGSARGPGWAATVRAEGSWAHGPAALGRPWAGPGGGGCWPPAAPAPIVGLSEFCEGPRRGSCLAWPRDSDPAEPRAGQPVGAGSVQGRVPKSTLRTAAGWTGSRVSPPQPQGALDPRTAPGSVSDGVGGGVQGQQPGPCCRTRSAPAAGRAVPPRGRGGDFPVLSVTLSCHMTLPRWGSAETFTVPWRP